MSAVGIPRLQAGEDVKNVSAISGALKNPMSIRSLFTLQTQWSWLVVLSTGAMPCSVLASDDRPATLAAAGGNPLALNAMAFLGWYWEWLLILSVLAIAVRLLGWRMNTTAGSPSTGVAEDPYLMAYLSGGPQRVIDTLMASLVQQGALRVNAVTRELIAEQAVSEDRPKIERYARNLLCGSHQITSAADFRRWLQRELQATLKIQHQRLRQTGLLGLPSLQAKAVLPLTLGFAALLGIGAIRLVAGILAGRPIGFLLVSLALTVLLAWWLLRGLGRERASARGKRLLEQSRSQLGQRDDDRIWMVALLGLDGYGMSAMVDLHHVLQVDTNDALFVDGSHKGKGSSAGDSSGGSGCGGGGCGG